VLNLNELIEKLYQKHLSSIATEKHDEKLKNRFEEYMRKKYQKFFDQICSNDRIRDRMLNDWYETEERHWGDLSNDAKYAEFTEDTAFIRIDQLSGVIFGMAKRKYTGDNDLNVTTIMLYEYIDEMRNLESQVFQSNKQTVQKLISEAIVEVEYIMDKSKNLSIRMGNIAKYLHN